MVDDHIEVRLFENDMAFGEAYASNTFAVVCPVSTPIIGYLYTFFRHAITH